MTNEDLLYHLGQVFPDASLVVGKQYVEMTIDADKLFDAAKCLKESGATMFDYLFCLSGLDFQSYMTVVYHLESTVLKHCMVLKTNTLDRNEPVLDSVMQVWHGAKYHEREVYDLLGIKFNNHNDLRRLFLDDEWGFPLRKDYADDVKIISR